MPSFKKKLSYLILGQKGGKNRLHIIEMLNERPYNLHQLTKVLNLNYRTIEHHINVMIKNELITTSESEGYGKIYYLSPEMESNIDILSDIRNKVEIYENLMEATATPQFFQYIIEQTNDAVIITDKDFNILLWNKNSEKLFGYKKEETIGSTIQFFSDLKTQNKVFKKLENGGEVGFIETQAKSRTAKSVNVELSANVIGTEKNIIGYSFLIRNISKRKKAERKSKEALEYAESIVNTVREPLVVLNDDLLVLSANRSFYQTFKVTSKNTENKHLYDLGNHQWDIPELRKLLLEINLKESSIENFEVEHDFEHIGKRIMSLNARQLRKGLNNANLILLAIEDITELRMADEGLAAIFYLSHDLIGIFDESNFKRVNPTWEKLMGWRTSELLSRPIKDFIHPKDLKTTKIALAMLKEKDVVYFENRYRKKDGKYRWLSWSASKWLHDLTYGVARDITDYKEGKKKESK